MLEYSNIAMYPNARGHVSLMFHQGAKIPGEHPLLEGEGSTSRTASSRQLEWGTKVRGHYEVTAAPALIALRWDFDDDAIPVPGRQLVGYLRFFDEPAGCRIEVHQRAADARQAAFLSTAWSMVLGRLKEHVEQPPAGPGPHRRPPRAKRSTGAIGPAQDADSAAG
jgi:hypothetical protein